MGQTVGFAAGFLFSDSLLVGMRVEFIGVDAQRGDCLGDRAAGNLSRCFQLLERRNNDVTGIDFEEITQLLAAVAATETVRPEAVQRTREPLSY